jgi:GABA(A) receptor-associated protein
MDSEAKRILSKFPGRVPVLVNRASGIASDIPHLPKSKFLVPSSLTVGQFIFIVRKQLIMPPEKALFLFVNNNLPTSSMLMSELYATYKDKDGFLRVIYTSESTFG